MSASEVSREHINYLLNAALDLIASYDSVRVGADYRTAYRLDSANAAQVGDMLIEANNTNLIYLYEDRVDVDTSRFRFVRRGIMRTLPEMVKAIKACHGYAYQCSDMPEWDGSEAQTFIERLERSLVRNLPGYDQSDGWAL